MKPEMNRSHDRPRGKQGNLKLRGQNCSENLQTEFSQIGQGPEVDSCEQGDEPLGSMKVGNFLIS